jgi:hypothetical protein
MGSTGFNKKTCKHENGLLTYLIFLREWVGYIDFYLTGSQIYQLTSTILMFCLLNMINKFKKTDLPVNLLNEIPTRVARFYSLQTYQNGGKCTKQT